MAITTSDIIEAAGGTAAISSALEIPFQTVTNWRVRSSIPSRYQRAILTLAKGKITAEQMIDAHADPTFLARTS